MIYKDVVHPSWGFTLIISLYNILIFNVESVDLSPDAGQALRGLDDSAKDRISHEINQSYSQKLRVLPNRGAVLSMFKVFAAVVVVVAISLVIVRCIKSLKSVDHKKSSRRLAASADQCGELGESTEGVLDADNEEETIRKITEWSLKLYGSDLDNPDHWKGIMELQEVTSGQWQANIIKEATDQINKTEVDTNLTSDQIEEAKRTREILYEQQILPRLDAADPTVLVMAAERLLEVAERSELSLEIDLSDLKTIAYKMKERQGFHFTQDYLAPLREALEEVEASRYPFYRKFLADSQDMLKPLFMYHNRLLMREIELKEYLNMFKLSDTQLLAEVITMHGDIGAIDV